MADLVLGVAKPLVLGTLERAQLAIEEESKFRGSTQRDLVFITGEFQMMQSFLSGTTEENVKSEVVSTWVTQVRDLAYDVEDGIEFVVHLDTKSDWWFRFVPGFLRPRLALDEAVDIIEQRKARVQDVSKRNERYRLICDSGSISDKGTNPSKQELVLLQYCPCSAVNDKWPCNISGLHVSCNHCGLQYCSRSIPSKERDMEVAAGGDTAWKQRDMEALTKLITKEKSSDLQVISIWAPNGDLARAASLMMKAYDDLKGWGTFSRTGRVQLERPNMIGFIKSLVYRERSEEVHVEQHEVLRHFNNYVHNRTCLFILKDLPESITAEEWQMFLRCLPTNNGSRVFVSTKHSGIASLCAGSPCFQRFSADLSLCVFFKEGPLIGRLAGANQLRRFLAKARVNGLQVISVWGTAGAGKSALVRNLYREKFQTSKEYSRYIWVDVSHPLNLRDFCRSLLLQFHSHSPVANEDTVTGCQGLLKDHQCLLVVDNLRSTKHWDLIHDALAFRPSRSIIIVITNEERTALHCADREDSVFNVKALEGAEAVDLFERQVEKRNIQSDPLIKEIIPKCGGLPEVIVAIADSLAHVYEWRDIAKPVNEKFIKNLETRHEFASLRDLFGWVHSYFRTCQDNLKPCIFYLSIFPHSEFLRRRRLVMRWIAEGFSKDKANESADESGEELFAKITELSMIQPAERTINSNIRMVRCRINAFFQEYIISRPNEENVTFALEVCALKGCCRQSTAHTGRHIVIEESWQRDEIVFQSIDFSRLRSLTVFGNWETYFISENMKVLRVLDLENASGVKDKDLKKMLKLLPRLKFLSLRNCQDIRNLPSSIGDLRQLQILDIRYTSIVTLPESITKLKKLQYLHAGTTIPPEDPLAPVFKVSKVRRFLKPVGVEVTSGVGKLTKLHTLGVVNVGSVGGEYVLQEVKNLTQLRKLGVFGIDKKNSKEFCSAISAHSHLQSLSVWFNKDKSLNGVSSELAEAPKNLQSLKLYRLANKLPVWISGEKLCNLRKINLEIEMSSKDDIGVIGGLPELCILRLRVKPPTDGKLNFLVMISSSRVEDRSYKKVKILEIACSSGSLDITFGKEAMQNLEVLKAGSCIRSVEFTEQKHLPELKEVYVIGSHVDTLKKHLEEILEDHPCKPRVENVDLSAPTRTEGKDRHSSFPFYPTDS